MIFVSTSCFAIKQGLVDRLRIYQQHGLMAVELSQGVTVTKDDLEQLQELPGTFLVHNYFPPPANPFVLNLASKDATIRQRSIEFACNALNLCSQLRIPFYSVHAGFVTDPTSFGTTSFIFPTPTSLDEKPLAAKRFRTSLEKVLDHAQGLGLQVLIENNVCTKDLRGKLLFQTADEILRLFRDLPSPHLGLLLDTGHLNVTAHTFSFDRMRFVERVAPHIRALHISDNDGTEDSGTPVCVGSWVLAVLQRSEFRAFPIVVEAKFESVDVLSQYVIWLRAKLG